jgi:hypothetical protein
MEDLRYQDDREIVEVTTRFEQCEFPPEEFTHARHLTVACWYLCTLPPDKALSRMRDGLQRFITHHQKQGYHETITRFWMELLEHYLRKFPSDTTLVSKVNQAIERFASKDVLFSYYTRECVMSDAARAAWITPDLRPIADTHPAVLKTEFLCILEALLNS